MYKMVLRAILIAVILAACLANASCNKQPFRNTPLEIDKVAWRLSAGEDGSPWVFLDIIIKNTGNKDIKEISYFFQYAPLWRNENDVLHMIDSLLIEGNLLDKNDKLVAGERDIIRIPICSWGIHQDRYVIEQIKNAQLCIYWIDYNGFGSWGIRDIHFNSEDRMNAFITNIDAWYLFDSW